MAELKDRLESVIRGESKPSDVKAWLDQVLTDGSVSPEVLLADLDAWFQVKLAQIRDTTSAPLH